MGYLSRLRAVIADNATRKFSGKLDADWRFFFAVVRKKIVEPHMNRVMTTHDKVPASAELMSLRVAAERLDLSLRGVYRLIARGLLPKPVKVGGASKLFETDIQAYMNALRAQRSQTN